ncbi:MAG: hypothetical protein JXR41_08060, partial [Bacteroidales bacterium]|nr:hypothetical protein [Bacteroidales bacterium]
MIDFSVYYRIKPLYLFLLIAFLLNHLQAGCQDPFHIKFENISVRDGLSQNTPNCIFQDSRGFLWIGTEDGLNKYNGYGFEVFKPDVNDPASISMAKITCIEEDDDGNLWIGTKGGGLNKYNRNTDIFQQFRADAIDTASILGDIVTCIKNMSDRKLWVGTNKGLGILNHKTGRFEKPLLHQNKP